MEIVEITNAKDQLSQLIQRALDGERIVIGESGQPLAELRPYPEPQRRVGGIWKGKVRMSDDFDEPLDGLK